MRRYLPWLFFAAAVFGLIGTLSETHVNLAWIGYRVTRLLIAVAYLLPHGLHR